MTLDALCAPSEVLIYDSFNAAAAVSAPASFLFGGGGAAWLAGSVVADVSAAVVASAAPAAEGEKLRGRRKRRRRARSGNKSREDAESHRKTHIAVERNRRRQMNEYLAVLRSLMPEPFVHRADQASIVGGAIDFVKELEQTLQSLEAQKRTLLAQQQQCKSVSDSMQMSMPSTSGGGGTATSSGAGEEEVELEPASARECDQAAPPFAWFFAYPQYVWCQPPRDGAGAAAAAGVADVEVSLVETHASVRVMAPRRPAQLLKLVAGMQELRLAVLHLNVTTLVSVALYTLSVKAEEGCVLTTADDIAAAVHHLLCVIDGEAATVHPSDGYARRGEAGALA